MATKQVVAGDVYFSLDGKLMEIKRQLRLPSGYPHDLNALELALQRISEGNFEQVLGPSCDPVVLQRAKASKLFCSPEEQVANIRTWNDQFLGGYFKQADFENLSTPPDWPSGKLSAVVLVPYLATVHGTFTSLWKATASQHRDPWCWDGYQKEASIRLLEGITHEPGLCWEVIDFGANWDKTNGTAPITVRTPANSPHAGILAAAAHFPKWLKRMDGSKVPYVWGPGYQVSVPGRDPWRHVVYLYRGGSGPHLDACWDDDRRSRYAVPVCRERRR